jgi:hypothetical protein
MALRKQGFFLLAGVHMELNRAAGSVERSGKAACLRYPGSPAKSHDPTLCRDFLIYM